MSTKDFTANVISATKVVPDGNFKDSKASGIWDINEALDLIKGGNWPNAANLNPASFVDGLFSVDVYTGTGSSQQITNSLDLSGKGGLVWTKTRDSGATNNHNLQDTVNGVTKYLQSNNTGDLQTRSDLITSFNSDGFTLGADASLGTANFNGNGGYVAWSWRKQPKFFDIVTYTGNGTSGHSISHSLGSVPGMIIVKNLDDDSLGWRVWHRSLTNPYSLSLNSTGAANSDAGYFTTTDPTSSVFYVGDSGWVNQNNSNFIAYLFAHNNDDGGFGEPGDQDIIKCGSYTGNGNATGPVVTLGFEPQFIMLKRTDDTENANWFAFDSLRGITTGGDDPYLYWNTTAAEVAGNALEVTSTGFQLKSTSSAFNGSSASYIYMAIRRGGMQTPTTASDVFAINVRSSSDGEGKYTSGFPVDFSLANNYDATGNTFAGTRLLNEHLQTNDNVTAGSSASDYEWDHNDGVSIGASGGFFGGSTNNINWMWKRARGYFDVVVYEGPDSTGNFSHNLGVVPEMIWVKNTDATENWAVYHKDLGNTYYLHLNTNAAASNTDGGNFWNSTTPTASVFSVGTSTLTSHYTRKHVAYLFATAAGVSKVGSYTGNGSSQNIDCGFSGGTGARFVLIKNADATGSWVIFDTTRGLVAGNDNYLRLDVTNAQGGGYDFIDPLESGFTINQTGGVVLNESGETYIFYAIA